MHNLSPADIEWIRGASAEALGRLAAAAAPAVDMLPKQFVANLLAVVASVEGGAKGCDAMRARRASVEAFLEARGWSMEDLRVLAATDDALDGAAGEVHAYLQQERYEGVDVTLKEVQEALDCALQMVGALDSTRVTARACSRAIHACFK